MFERDTFRIADTTFCLGCAMAYPTAVLTLILFVLFRWDRLFPTLIFHRESLLALAVLLGCLQFIKYKVPLRSRSFRASVKVALGASIGMVFFWIFTLPTNLIISIAILILFSLAAMLIATYRFVYIRKVCAGCVYHGDWDICYGFRGFNLFCRLGIGNPARIRRNIFDRGTKKRLMERGEEGGCPAILEPPLNDVPEWLYHEDSYRIPWLPLTGLEVTDRSGVPRR
jgi:hypothetical protein